MTETTADRTDETGYPDITPLLQPLQIGPLRLKNRIVMPGMQRAWCIDCAPSDKMVEYYRQRALGGTALVITEAAAPDHWSGSSNPMFAKLNPRTRDAWRACVDAVHEAGGKIFLQIWHQGSREMGNTPPEFQGLSPSGLITKDLPNGRPATLQELADIKAAFAQSAAVVREIGADGVEVHACHGYFLDEFLWSEINLRTDKYGGPTIAERATYPAEVVAAVRAAVGPDFPISVRLSQWKEEDFHAKVVETPEELAVLLAILRAAGADLFHMSTRRFWVPEWPGDDRGFAGWAKSLTDAPVIAVGSIGLDVDVMATLEGEETRPTGPSRIWDLMSRFERGDFDLVAVGRSLIGDPEWVSKMSVGRGHEIRPFVRGDLEWLT
jgi:2,4-dienoyl-CoA reductase-like NADH-dependent reductase (Old Yellow Enzyme family)